MNILDRFLNYVKISTGSDSHSNQSPSTDKQFKLADVLESELKNLGLETYYDREYCYVYAKLKGDKNKPSLGFISHMDTSDMASDKNIKPMIIENYNCTDIKYPNGKELKVKDNLKLKNEKGNTLILSDGSTLLGADDKAGIAEIMAMLEVVIKSNVDHGDIYVCFTPDEEIGLGVEHLNLNKFPVKYAYTVDGEDVGEISYENFNAATAKIEIEGTPYHPGHSKGKMINSILVANEFISLLPNEIPFNTENYEGFYHLGFLNGTVSKTVMKYFIRDFYEDGFQKRKDILKEIADKLNEKYNNCVTLNIKDSYYNMLNIIKKEMIVVDIVKKSMEEIGITPIVKPIRGGTDGVRISYMGIPCPNIGTGSHNFHSVYEYTSLENMEKTCDILVNIVKNVSNIDNKIKVKK